MDLAMDQVWELMDEMMIELANKSYAIQNLFQVAGRI